MYQVIIVYIFDVTKYKEDYIKITNILFSQLKIIRRIKEKIMKVTFSNYGMVKRLPIQFSACKNGNVSPAENIGLDDVEELAREIAAGMDEREPYSEFLDEDLLADYRDLYCVLKSDRGGKVKKKFISVYGDKLSAVMEYSPKTGKKLKVTEYQEDGKTVDSVAKFSPETGKMSKFIKYRPNGKTLDSITEYSAETDERSKFIKYRRDGKTLDRVEKYSILSYPSTVPLIKLTQYQSDGKKIVFALDYNSLTGKLKKLTKYQPDSKKVDGIYEYSPETGKRIKYLQYRQDGKTLKYVHEYSPEIGKRTKYFEYLPDGKVDYVHEYSPRTGEVIKTICYKSDGRTVDRIGFYQWNY